MTVCLSGKFGSNIEAVSNAITRRWNSINSEPIKIIEIKTPQQFDNHPEALRVRLWCSSAIRRKRAKARGERYWETDDDSLLDDYVVAHKFDTSLNTKQIDPDKCAELICFILQQNNWKMKRWRSL